MILEDPGEITDLDLDGYQLSHLLREYGTRLSSPGKTMSWLCFAG